jgi:hypothetical protein
VDNERDDAALELDLQQEMEVLTPYQNPTPNSHEEVIRMMEACPVCGNRMHFTHFADFTRLLTHETVRCEDCGYRAKREFVRLL